MNKMHRWHSKYPELGTGPIAVDAYTSQEQYDAEIEKIFRRTWLCVGLEGEILNRGDYKVKRIECLNTSVILIRGKDDVVRAFHNVCSHRCNAVVTETGLETFGRNKACVLTCRFHGWVFGADGTLLSVPQEENFYDDFDKSNNSLTAVHCETWSGFIFINVSDNPQQTLHDFLGEYRQHFKGYPFNEMGYEYSFTTELNCNWKVAHDAFTEAYHVNTIHAGSFPNVFSGELEDVKLMGPHRTSAVYLSKNGRPTAMSTLANSLAKGSLVANHGESMLPPTINPERRTDFSFELSVMFPNTLVIATESIWFTLQFWPVEQNKTLWESRYYVQKPQTYSELWALEYSIVIQRNAWLEDTATMEATQRAMESGAKKWQNLQDHEILIRHATHVVNQFVAG